MRRFATFSLLRNHCWLSSATSTSLLPYGKAVIKGKPLTGGGPLGRAAQHGHLSVVKVLLDSKTNPDGEGALGKAAARGHVDVVNALLEAGANPWLTDHRHQTALHEAASHGHVAVVRTLLQQPGAGEAVKVRNVLGQTALDVALAADKSEVVALFRSFIPPNEGGDVARGASSAPPPSRPDPLIVAAIRGRLTDVESLLRSGTPVDVIAKDGQTPLMKASGFGHVDVVKVLLAAGANVNAEDAGGETALSRTRHPSVARVLLEAGARINHQDKRGFSALSRSANSGTEEMVQLLLSAGASVHTSDLLGNTPLRSAAALGHLQVARLLLKAGANVNAKNHKGDTPLTFACANGQLEIVNVLLEQPGIAINEADDIGSTALMMAASVGDLRICAALINAKADVNLQRHDGMSALSRACFLMKLPVVDLMLSAGANPWVQDAEGMTPLHRLFDNHGHAKSPGLALILTKYLLHGDARTGVQLRDHRGRCVLDLVKDATLLGMLQQAASTK